MLRDGFDWLHADGDGVSQSGRLQAEAVLEAVNRVGERPDAAASFGAAPYASIDLLLSILDELCFGILVVGKRRQLSYANRLGALELRDGDTIRLERDRVEATNPTAAGAFQRAIDAACQGRRGFAVLGDTKMVASLPAGNRGCVNDPRALLILDRNTASRSLDFVFFAQAHGLTAKEEQVLTKLADGASVEEVACDLHCALSTARTHVRNILAKTSQSSLRRLTSRLGRLPALCPRVLELRSRDA